MRNESLPSHNRNKSLALVAVICAVAFVGIAFNKRPSGTMSVHTNILSTPNDVLSDHAPTLADMKKCLQQLRAQIVDDDVTKVPRSPNAKYHFIEDGETKSTPVGKVSSAANAIGSAVSNQPHKGYWITDESMALVYTNNVVVTVDSAPVCQVTNVYEPTSQNEIHPLAKSHLQENKLISPDDFCAGYFRIKGAVIGTYLNYDTNTNKVLQGHNAQIDAPDAPMDDYKKWRVEYLQQTILDGTPIHWVYRVKSGKISVQPFLPYLTVKDTASGPTNELCSYSLQHAVLNSANTHSGKGLVWQFYRVAQDTPSVTTKLPPVFVSGQKIVMYNYYTKSCLCIMNNIRSSADGVKMCPCSDPHAVLIFETVDAPTT